MSEGERDYSWVLRQQHAASLLICPRTDARQTSDAPPASHCLFGKRCAGALQCWWSFRQNLLFTTPPVCLPLPLSLSFLTVSVGSATLSVCDVRATLSHMWSERQGCCWCQPTQLSAALVTVDLTAGAAPLPLVIQQQGFFSFNFLWLPWICFSISASKGLYCAGSQLNYADSEKWEEWLMRYFPSEE